MRLKSLKMVNFRRFDNVVVEFGDGIVGVVGENGVGKSTIVDGIGYALYGAVSAVVRTTKGDMRRSDSLPNERWGVELSFDHGGNSYRVMRFEQNKKADVKLYETGSLVANDDGPVKAYLRGMLGMDYNAFSASVFCRQNEVAILSNMQPSERKRLILRTLGIDGLDVVLKEIRSKKRDKEKRLDALLEAVVDENGTDLLGGLMDDRAMNRDAIDELGDMKADVEVELSDVNTDVDGIRQERTDILKRRADAVDERDEIVSLITIADARRWLEEEIAELEKAMITEDSEEIEPDCDIESQIVDINSEIMALGREIAQIKEFVDSLEAGSECPTCRQKITVDYVGSVKEKMTKTSNELSDRADEKADELKSFMVKKQDFDKRREINAKKDELSRLPDVDLSSVESKSKTIDGLISDCDDDLSGVDDRQDALLKKQRELQTSLNDTVSKLSTCEAYLKNIDEKIDEYHRRKNQISEETTEVANLKVLEGVMGDFRTHMISRVCPVLSAFASVRLQEMSDGRYTRLELDDNYNILMYDGGKAYPVERFSGGEKDIANLALRLSLSHMVAEQSDTGTDFIVLDEVFGSADTVRRETIMTTLERLLSRYKQIICITHIDAVQDMMPRTIRVVTDGYVSSVNL